MELGHSVPLRDASVDHYDVGFIALKPSTDPSATGSNESRFMISIKHSDKYRPPYQTAMYCHVSFSNPLRTISNSIIFGMGQPSTSIASVKSHGTPPAGSPSCGTRVVDLLLKELFNNSDRRNWINRYSIILVFNSIILVQVQRMY